MLFSNFRKAGHFFLLYIGTLREKMLAKNGIWMGMGLNPQRNITLPSPYPLSPMNPAKGKVLAAMRKERGVGGGGGGQVDKHF